MKHLFLPYELAVIAKQKGFNERCLASINPQNQIEIGNTSYLMAFMAREKKDIFTPTYQQVVDWFRENHNKHITIIPIGFPSKDASWSYTIFTMNIGNDEAFDKSPMGTFTYYGAFNKAIEEAFKLI